ncbi:siroheme synthase CysG [Martelella radicis]|uniref:Uroporphyrin-III C-methyltransferase/precorrin-2 dehydrogenase/sirohydrochlorin ferrochelatase n=1 Tax=Martelella radicis TaxID=1397476 RepID=A0A7W6PAP5_9HYPH|nr:siroheme synthase CysG [Martelella radicis]MBB4123562.1 uroporphyrin-III C-methyltransferase/precorrin-2 dehydrogenase/sirohydrochlorin ferrochelatase [Martelella radicis]
MATGRARTSVRMEALAVLPLFFQLKGKPVLVAGGSDAAAWKAELMAAAGADVTVFLGREAADEALLALEADGRVHLSGADWSTTDWTAFELALGDCENDTEAQAFRARAKAEGVPVNVIDKPAYCDFQFGSIVNRSPVVVGISTDGAAPILGQAIRRRIETQLPKALAEWAGLAARLRDAISLRMKPGGARRAFWEHFVDLIFSGASGPDERAEERLLARAEVIAMRPQTGSVTLVGAGPGDPELLTLKAMRVLQSADVILFDDLISPQVLELARREAKRMLVGKRGGRASCRQEDINRMMLDLARSGKRVVRLKSGDPSVFGRSGEEITELQHAGIPVSVIPGITAASALAAGTTTSLTHRDCAQSVRFVTGHSRKGELPTDIDWRAIADPTTTTMFYMGGRTAGEIGARLIKDGLPPETPVLIASNISRADEKRWHGTLAGLGDGMAEIGYDDPVLFGVGRVFTRKTAMTEAIAETRVLPLTPLGGAHSLSAFSR